MKIGEWKRYEHFWCENEWFAILSANSIFIPNMAQLKQTNWNITPERFIQKDNNSLHQGDKMGGKTLWIYPAQSIDFACENEYQNFYFLNFQAH